VEGLGYNLFWASIVIQEKIVENVMPSFLNRRGFIMLLLCGVLTLLTGCAVGPDYVRPTAETPAAYKENAGWKVAEPRDNAIKGAWWEIYDDPQLNVLEGQVNVSNQNIAAAEAQFRQATALVHVSEAGLFPIVGATVTPSRSSRATGGIHGSPRSRTTTSDFLLTGLVSWELDVWGKIRRTVESNEASARASAADLEAIRLSMQATLAQDYFQLRALDAQKQLFDVTISEYQKNLDLTKNRYAGGVAAKSDVLKAETQLKTTQAQAIDIRVQRAQLEHAIATIIGKPASVFSIPFSPLASIPPQIPAGIPSDLLERRPDIAGAERRMAAANAQIGVAKAAYYPAITLNGSGGFDAATLSKWLVWPSRFWSIGSTAAETILDFGLRGAQTDQAIAAYDASVATYRQSVLTGFQEVEDNLASLRILEEEASMQAEAVKASRQSTAVSINQYRSGIISYIDVITVLAIQFNNEQTAIGINGRRMAASVLLIKALGGGWDYSALRAENAEGGKDAVPKISNPAKTAATDIPKPKNE
jgi:NodT family efflux transporter outer membrane factor (OMF) lipoprotein